MIFILVIVILIFVIEKKDPKNIILVSVSSNKTIKQMVDLSEIEKNGFQNLDGKHIVYDPDLLSADYEEYEVEGHCSCCTEDRRQFGEICVPYGIITVFVLACTVWDAQQNAVPLLLSKCDERACDFVSKAHIDNVKAKYLNKIWFCNGECTDIGGKSNICTGDSPGGQIIGPVKTAMGAGTIYLLDYLDPYCKKNYENCVGFKTTILCVRDI
jgi:hypothetical protein